MIKENLEKHGYKIERIIDAENKEILVNNPDPFPIMRAYYFCTVKPKKNEISLDSPETCARIVKTKRFPKI